MNDILATEMEEALYGMDSNEHQKEGFVVNDDNKADWALKRIKENQAKIDEISELYEQQTLRLVHWRNEEMDKLIKSNEALESMIMPYAAAKLEKVGINPSSCQTENVGSVPCRPNLSGTRKNS
ncbi:MAG: host-nuclease inhibitor Gam family protein [Acidaminococcus intestini]